MGDSEDEDEAPKSKGNKFSDVQKAHLSKLMANPDKPVPIPERPKPKTPKEPPEFVRFYMGSSAGAGSEVFHVYRHLRRRENERQQIIQEGAEDEIKELEFQEKLLANRLAAEERTSKKRAKRLKKKQKKLQKKKETTNGEDPEETKNKEKVDSSEEEEEQQHFVIGGR